ncbi:MAG TPA: RnfH family protein [Rhodanobacteraceae bacterium]|nr:RnfH family protein [Rhodanobacteraceae bacterium]
MAESIRATVVYAIPERVFQYALTLPSGSTVAEAVAASGLYRDCPDAHAAEPRYGIYSRRVDAAMRLRDGDRVEVYRPLIIDPKQARRQRARQDKD